MPRSAASSVEQFFIAIRPTSPTPTTGQHPARDILLAQTDERIDAGNATGVAPFQEYCIRQLTGSLEFNKQASAFGALLALRLTSAGPFGRSSCG